MVVREQLIHLWHQVVAADDADAPTLQTVLGKNVAGSAGTSPWIHTAGVGDDLQLWLLLQDWRKAFKHIEKIGRIAGIRIALLLQRENRHGQFGEVFQSQILKFAVARQEDRRIE